MAGAQFVVNVEAAIVREGQYLLIQRASSEEHAAGEWALVGGTIEAEDETGHVAGSEGGPAVLRATVRREVREEVGITVDALAYLTSSTFEADTGTRVLNVVFLGRHGDGEPRIREPTEVDAVAWHDPGAIQTDEDIPAYTREYVATAERRRRELDW